MLIFINFVRENIAILNIYCNFAPDFEQRCIQDENNEDFYDWLIICNHCPRTCRRHSYQHKPKHSFLAKPCP